MGGLNFSSPILPHASANSSHILGEARSTNGQRHNRHVAKKLLSTVVVCCRPIEKKGGKKEEKKERRRIERERGRNSEKERELGEGEN